MGWDGRGTPCHCECDADGQSMYAIEVPSGVRGCSSMVEPQSSNWLRGFDSRHPLHLSAVASLLTFSSFRPSAVSQQDHGAARWKGSPDTKIIGRDRGVGRVLLPGGNLPVAQRLLRR